MRILFEDSLGKHCYGISQMHLKNNILKLSISNTLQLCEIVCKDEIIAEKLFEELYLNGKCNIDEFKDYIMCNSFKYL